MRVVSGMRPTGRLHLGHYFGVIKNWLELQNNNECFFFAADWHALSTKYEDKLSLKALSLDLIKTWIACGIDMNQSTLFIQSHIKEHAELYLILNMITPVNWLERNPSYKDLLTQNEYKDKNMAGFLTYPVLQTADIILYDAQIVPIGEDQKPHLELAREIVRRFHHLFGTELFVEPKDILTPTSKLPGIDGRKMSKSYNNSIYLDDTSEDIWQKIRNAKTDTNRIKKTDPGNPEVCVVWEYHKIFSSQQTQEEIYNACTKGTIGCVACKKQCAQNIDTFIAPIREKKEELKDELIVEMLHSSTQKAQQVAKAKLAKVNEVIL
ncbi:MAG: tryptophan--tRNA ligase [Epsilonproteobacteria bacterium]|nr:tryptophan--tRNA ligase [Campylobacterota bacterium]